MERSPLISVIVPVYNVEQYLEECVDSIIEQTYKNLEIILVDDGSLDRCPEICESYKDKDNRIVVIHQENQGLSAARNSGILAAKGEFIAFVDSDDYINRHTYEKMIKAQQEYEADIVACGVKVFNDGEKPEEKVTSDVSIYSVSEVLKTYLYDDSNISVIACNKLYRRKAFDNVLFEKGRLFEDFIPITKIIISSSKIVSVDSELYYYRHRENSINTANFNVKKFNSRVLDLSYSVDSVIDIISDYNKDLLEYIVPACLKAKLSVANQMIISKSIDKKYVADLGSECRKYKSEIYNCEHLSKLNKFQLLLFGIFCLYKPVYILMKGLKK